MLPSNLNLCLFIYSTLHYISQSIWQPDYNYKPSVLFLLFLLFLMQARGPSSVLSVTRPLTRRALCRSIWSNTRERSHSSVRCAASDLHRRATWSTIWRGRTATVSSWHTKHQWAQPAVCAAGGIKHWNYPHLVGLSASGEVFMGVSG